jgi:hypothetical protein
MRPGAARFALALLLLAPARLRAQLDLGTGDVPQDRIDGYVGPFHRLLAAGLAQGRFGPDRGRTGIEAGFQACLMPLPDRDPFRSASLSALPLFRLRAGAFGSGAAAQARGLYWKDPRAGSIAAYGVGFRYGSGLGGSPFRAELEIGWDRLVFSSTYTYRYRGSALGLFDQDVPGDYRLTEQVFGGAAGLSFRRGEWIPYANGGWDWASGRFAYLYVDPRDGIRRLGSRSSFPCARGAAGLSWRGFRAEAAWAGYLALEAAWSHAFRIERAGRSGRG